MAFEKITIPVLAENITRYVDNSLNIPVNLIAGNGGLAVVSVAVLSNRIGLFESATEQCRKMLVRAR